ncbi:spore germination protein GerPE [Bacillus licheniformis]|nr:spore germination protein GerPE [Bacillus licheniformis]
MSRWRRNHDSQNVQSEVLKVHSVGISSTLQIGDTEEQFLKSKVLAVQRYLSLFTEMKGHLNRMISAFRQPIPQLLPETGVCSAFSMRSPSSV